MPDTGKRDRLPQPMRFDRRDTLSRLMSKRTLRDAEMVPNRTPPEPSLALNKTYVGQRAGRGLANALGGAPDFLNELLVNAPIRDIDYWTGGGLSGGTYDPYQLKSVSDWIANQASNLSGERIVKPQEVSPAARNIGDVSELLTSLFLDPTNYFGAGVGTASKLGKLR